MAFQIKERRSVTVAKSNMFSIFQDLSCNGVSLPRKFGVLFDFVFNTKGTNFGAFEM